MFHFFKKSGHKDRPRTSEDSPIKSINSEKSLDARNASLSIQTSWGLLCSFEEEEEDETCDEGKEPYPLRSQLSKTLPEILSDKGALGYFIQFMETKNAIALIKFWLEVECLHSASLGVQHDDPGSGYLELKNVCLEDTNGFPNSIDSIESLNVEHKTADNKSNEPVDDKNVNSDGKESNHKTIPKISETLCNEGQSNCNCEKKRSNISTNKQDALRIYRRYIIRDALGTNRIPEELKSDLEKALDCENIEPILTCLSTIQKIIYSVLENEYINDFLRSTFHCKHQIDVLTSGNVQLADILYNETAFFYFMEFMELENRRELLDFWMSVVSYKQNLCEKGNTNNVDPIEAQNDALIIYDKYFSLQARKPLGFSDKIRFQVEQNICHEDGEGPRADCFDKPCKIVYNFLNKYLGVNIIGARSTIFQHYLPTFLSSQLYYKYLSELISTIQSSPCSSLHSKIKRAGSDCSSEVSSISVSVQNHKAGVNGSMSIDTRQLYDPDSLWKRTKYSLSVGYIDQLGRFITEIEPDPQRKYESRLTRAMKRLVNMEQDKDKEELAWKIAGMIVREITSLTLGASNISSY